VNAEGIEGTGIARIDNIKKLTVASVTFVPSVLPDTAYFYQ
jgi:hypothetical protein